MHSKKCANRNTAKCSMSYFAAFVEFSAARKKKKIGFPMHIIGKMHQKYALTLR